MLPSIEDLRSVLEQYVEVRRDEPSPDCSRYDIKCDFGRPEILELVVRIQEEPFLDIFIEQVFEMIGNMPTGVMQAVLFQRVLALVLQMGMTLGRNQAERDPLVKLMALEDTRKEKWSQWP